MLATPRTRSLVADVHEAGWIEAERQVLGNVDTAVQARMDSMTRRFLPARAGRLVASWNIDIEDQGEWVVHVADGTCHIAPGRSENPVAELTTDAATWVALVDGRADGIRSFLAGRLALRGDLNLALRLETLFRPGTFAATPLEVRRTRVRGLTLESLVTGSGRPVVLLHGLAAHKISFVPTLVGLADAGCEVHALDLPGFGKSDKPLPAGRRYTMGWLADQVHGYLVRNDLRDAVLVGNSMGGRVATEVALRHPGSITGMVGLGAAVAFDEWQRFGPLLARAQFHWAAAAPPLVKRSWIANVISDLLLEDRDDLPSTNVLAAADDVMVNIRDRRYRMATAACARNLIRERAEGPDGYWDRLGTMDVPSLWIWGRRDQLVSHRYSERIAATVPGSQVQVWDGIGHVPQFEAPHRTNREVLDFLDRL